MAFKKKHRLPFTLISDSNKDMAKAFSVPVTLGFASRQAFLIVDGKIAWLDRHASTDKQAADVLEVLAKLK
jgi:peroxiredoxin